MGMPPPVPTFHFCVCHPGSGGYPGGGVLFYSGRGGSCCVRYEHKRKFLEMDYPKWNGVLADGGVVWGL